MKKSDLFQYMLWRGDIDFRCVGLCEIDNLIFSLLAFIDYSDIADAGYSDNAIPLLDVVGELEKLPPERRYLGAIIPDEINDLALVCAYSPRYRDVRVCGYENIIDDKSHSQFSAVSFVLPSGEVCVVYRGTDDTLVGWKENLDMSFLVQTRAQKHAVRYLQEIAEASAERKLYVCGHSKGGNLAIWAAVNSKKRVRDRILYVYNNDGPGFSREFINSPNYVSMKDRMMTFIPQHSVVGIFFEHDENCRIVKSSSLTIMSHDAFSWRLSGPRLLDAHTRTKRTQKNDESINAWISSLTAEQKRDFVQTLYSVLTAGGAVTLSDLKKNMIRHATAIHRAIRALDPSAAKNVRYVIGKIFNKKLEPPFLAGTDNDTKNS